LTGPYQVELTPAAQRDLRGFDSHIRKKITADLLRLEETPRPPDAERLASKEKLYRIHVGPGKNYRAIYQIADQVLRVLVVRVGDRKEVYRRLK
jgi:mRNA interferase RelE/StbE